MIIDLAFLARPADETMALRTVDGNRFDFVVHCIRAVHTAMAAVPVEGRPPIERVPNVVTHLCHDAWDDVLERGGWGDAEWWQYLNLAECLPWMAVALGLPGENPEEYGDLVEPVAWRTVPDSLGELMRRQTIPSNFVNELSEACVTLARAETERTR